jgi:transcriptional regulator with XRE-family HTH domain
VTVADESYVIRSIQGKCTLRHS